MAQNTVQSTDALYFEDAIVYIADYSTSKTNDSLSDISGATWTNIGAITEMSREAAKETSQPAAMNVEHNQLVTKEAENINITIQELNMTNYNKLLGQPAQSQSVAGTSTSASDTYAAGAVTANSFIKFKNQSWSSTSADIPIAPTSIVVTGSSVFVTPGDYEVMTDGNNFQGIMLTSTGSHSTSAGITVAYDLVPKSQTILWHGGADELTPFMLQVYNISADGRTIITYYPRVEYVSGGAISDKANASGEFKDVALALQARIDDDYTYSNRKIYKIDVVSTA